MLEDALREALARRRRPAKHKVIRFKTVRGDGVRPGVELDDASALLELMES